jgi:type I restriction enzyme S subunit
MKAPEPPITSDQVHRQHADDWSSGRLEDYWAVTDCKHVTAAFVDSGYPVVSIGEVQSRYVDLRNAPRTTQEFYRLLTQGPRKPAPGDLIMSRNASVGHVSQVTDRHQLFAMGQDVCLLRRRNSAYSPNYLQFLLESPSMENQFSNLMAGSTFKRLNVKDIKDLRITFPAPPMQASIGEALGNTEDQIEALKGLIAKKQAIKQGMMQQLLSGKMRLAGFARDWHAMRLGEVARIKTGSRNNQDKNPSGLYPFFVRSAIVERIDTYSYDCEAILVPGEGGIGSIFHYVNGKFEVHQRVYKISNFRSETFGKFVYYYMQQFFGRHAMENSVKATVDSLRLPTFKSFSMRIPKQLAEQQAIAGVLDDITSEVDLLKQRLAKAKAVKQGMMQELLTGRTRLPIAEGVA